MDKDKNIFYYFPLKARGHDIRLFIYWLGKNRGFVCEDRVVQFD